MPSLIQVIVMAFTVMGLLMSDQEQVVARPVRGLVQRSPNPASGSKTSTSSAHKSSPTSDRSGSKSSNTTESASASSGSGSCFPALGHKMPSSPPSSPSNWWCKYEDEYAFMGFGYEVTACQSSSQLKKDFKNIRDKFKGRYVRLYGACDKSGFNDDLIEAAWEAGIGIQHLIWWGFDKNSNTIWKTRRDNLVKSLTSNKKAPFVVRAVQFGSEPLYDGVLSPKDLATQVTQLKAKLKSVKIPVTVSDLAYGFQKSENQGKAVLDVIDFVDAHTLPYFVPGATTAKNSWKDVTSTVDFFTKNAKGKKIYLTENGWPSEKNSMFTSKTATADVQNEKDYYDLLNSKCSYFKSTAGGIGWFAHLYSDDMEPGYGIYDKSGKTKFAFSPKTSC